MDVLYFNLIMCLAYETSSVDVGGKSACGCTEELVQNNFANNSSRFSKWLPEITWTKKVFDKF